MAKQSFQNVRGTYDILPDDQPKFTMVRQSFINLAEQAGFKAIETPILEDSAVFSRSVGSETDIVAKEMYTFEDRSGNQISLRPEGTAGVVRSYIQHGGASWPRPVKLYYFGPFFRYDRPQAGRQRQFNQLGLEVFGEAAPSIDAQVIMLARRLLHQLGLPNLSLQLNSIGDGNCRPKYQKALVEYLKANRDRLCDDCKERLERNPLRVLDCKEKDCQAVIAGAPQTLNFLCKACHSHFRGVLEYMDELGVEYELNPILVRGLDYYSRTVFEFYGQREGAQSSLGGGGRYDGLVEMMGGQPTPAVGFSMGLERIILEMSEAGVQFPESDPVKVYVASLGEPARIAAFRLIEQLLDGGVGATGSVDKDGIGGQLSRANKLSVPFAIIIGQKEVFDQTVILRDMASGAQEMIPVEKIVREMQKRFV